MYRKLVTLISLWLFLVLLSVLAIVPTIAEAQSPSADSWQVYGSVDVDNMTRGANRLSNAGFESGSSGWTGYGSRFTIDSSQAHSGSNSARIDGGSLGAALQGVTLDQSYAKPIYVSGWSKSISAPGDGKMNYSLYFDIVYTDGTVPYSPYYAFSGGTHDWEQVDEIIYPEKPIKTIHLWCMFNSSGGQAWFDDLAVGEFTGEIRHFDEQQVIYAVPDEQPWSGSPTVQASTGDGLALTMSAYGAMPTSLTVDGQQQLDGDALYTGGFFVRDVANGSGYVHLGGVAEQQGGNVRFAGSDDDLGLALDAMFYSLGDRILIDASLRDTSGADRAISLYYALPIAPDGRTWWKDIRTGVPADSLTEHRFALDTEWGANGYMSHYCLSSLSGPSGLAMAYPMDRPVVSRFSYNSATYQYYFVADLGLAEETQPNPRQADVRFMLYCHDPDWGFRAAFDKYVGFYPHFFEDRCEEDGVWVAHAELDDIPDIDDFHIQFHETGNSRVYAADDALGIYTLRYLIEPWAYWLNAPDSVDTRDYDQVMAYVNTMLSSDTLNERRWGQAILSSGIHDADGRIRYEPLSEAFMSHAAAFVLDGNPNLTVPGYDYTKGTQSWSDNTMDVYNHPEWGLLDGEYIDSFESRGTYSDFATTHFAASSHPLTFDTATSRPVLPEIFSSYELAKTISENIHSIDRLVMANSTLLRWAFPAHLFDIMGSERGWVYNGQFLPDVDNLLNLWRTFSYHKPYAVLQNGDLTSMDHAMVERYFQHAAFYGIYPSFFTYDGGVTNYWTTPEWYERDRDLHMKYIPIIKMINAAGWEPVTVATADNGHIYVERYGDGDSFYIALLNIVEYPQNTTVSIDVDELDLPAIEGYDMSEVITGESIAYTVQNQGLAIPMTLPANTTRILRVTFTNAEIQEVPLSAGWNLVSLPGVPYSTNPATVMNSLGDAIERAYGWDVGSQSWLRYDPGLPIANTLDSLSAGQGLWLNVNRDTTWRVGCLAQHEYDVELASGWNLVGSPLNRSISAGQVLDTLGSAYDVFYGYQAEADLWNVYARAAASGENTLDAIDPGHGYWVLANQDTTWHLTDGATPPPTETPRPTNTPVPSPTPTQTLTPSITPTASNTPIHSPTPYPSATPTSPSGPAPTNTPLPSGEGESLPLVGDNYINQWAPSNNNGSYFRLMVRQGDIYASLIQFDTSGIPEGTEIQAATLRVWAEHRTNSGSLEVSVYPVTRAWDEMQSSWYQATSGDDWEAAGCNGASDRTVNPAGGVTFNNVGVWFNIDVTDAVQAWVDGSMENNGFVLKGSGSVSVSYELSSRNDSSSYKHPKLDVVY